MSLSCRCSCRGAGAAKSSSSSSSSPTRDRGRSEWHATRQSAPLALLFIYLISLTGAPCEYRCSDSSQLSTHGGTEQKMLCHKGRSLVVVTVCCVPGQIQWPLSKEAGKLTGTWCKREESSPSSSGPNRSSFNRSAVVLWPESASFRMRLRCS